MGNSAVLNRFSPWPRQCRYCIAFRAMTADGCARCALLGRDYLCPESGCDRFQREAGSDDDLPVAPADPE